MNRMMLLALSAGFLVASCGAPLELSCDRPPPTLRFIGRDRPTALQVEVASTAGARAQGLMGRVRLPADQGMVFLFPRPTTDRFWMKDTKIPLSIAFWDEHHRVVEILDMDPCAADPCPTFGPSVPYDGAVEVNQGYFAEHGVERGDRVELVGRGCG